MAGTFSRGGTVSPTVAEDLFTMPPVCLFCAEKEGIYCIGLYLNLSVELYEMEPERNYAMVLGSHRIDLLAISVT